MHWKSATSTMLRTVLSQPRMGIVTDTDGTISPIVDQPDAALIPPRIRELLRALHTQLALVAVISGRAVVDVRDRVGLPQLVYIGNHGMEWWHDEQVQIAPEVTPFRPALEAALRAVTAQTLPGMRVEDKTATLSIHYRQTAHPPAAEAMLAPILQDISKAHDLRLFRGRMVFEIRPPVSIHKGSAFRELVVRYRLDSALYLGDDVTDADALIMARQLREDGTCYALGIGVESDHTPDAVRHAADLFASGVQDVGTFLSWVLKARSASST